MTKADPLDDASNVTEEVDDIRIVDQPQHLQGITGPVADPPLEQLAALSEDEFRRMFRHTPVTRARYSGFLRNVAVAMGNARHPKFRAALERLAESADPVVAEHARWGLANIATVG